MLQHKRIPFHLLARKAALLAVFLTACGTASSRQPTPTPLPPLVSYEKAVFLVERGAIVSEQKINGEIVPARQDELFFRATGFVTRVAVKRGDVVKKGDVLAEMQIDDLLNQLQQARIDLEVSQADLAKFESQHQYDIEKAKADVVIWQQQVKLAEMDVEETWGKDKIRAELRLDITRQNLVLAEQSLKLISEDVNPYMEQAVKRSELAVQRLEGLVAERQIIAPYDCIILKSVVRPGQQVDAYYVVFNVGDPTGLVVRSQFDWDLNSKMTKDSEVRLYLSADSEQAFPVQFLPNFLPFTNTEENPTTQTISSDFMYFTIPAELPKDEVRVGRTVNLTLVLGKKDNVLLLPPAAIREYKGLNFVIIIEGDKRRRVEINEIGLKSSDRWEIVADLSEGDQILGP
jgi:multidrug efflux pump subunit AcrA (membrane-fusion protein)